MLEAARLDVRRYLWNVCSSVIGVLGKVLGGHVDHIRGECGSGH